VILASSPANNAGNSSLDFDQRGVARAVGNAADIGAFEQATTFIVVDNSSDISDSDFSAGNLSLREAIELSEQTVEVETITFDPSIFDGEATDVIRLQQTLQITESISIDGGDLGVVITGDSAGNDLLVSGTFFTDISNDSFNAFDNVQLFNVTASAESTVALSGLGLTGGAGNFFNFDIGTVGGVVFNEQASLLINDSNLVGNGAASNFSSSSFSDFGGGAIAADEGDVTLIRSTLTDNFSSNSGGAIYIDSGTLIVTESTIDSNRGGFNFGNPRGGGIFSNDGDVIISNSTISRNTAESDNGGGVYSILGDVTISGSTFSGNQGGIEIFSGSLSIVDSTITGNDPNFFNSAGILLGDGENFGFDPPGPPLFTVRNSIIADNSGGDIRFISPRQTADISSSIIGTNAGNSLLATDAGLPDANGNLIGSDAIIDPQLAELADNGGPTETHALLPTSPAINAGNSTLSTDQRGEPRIVGLPTTINSNGADIGAFERQTLVLVVDTNSDVVDGDKRLTLQTRPRARTRFCLTLASLMVKRATSFACN